MSNHNEVAARIKRDVLNASFEAGACHLGSALSCVHILVNLFYSVLKEGDVFVFSKASGSATYYAILADMGYFLKEELAYYLKNYPEASVEVPGVTHSVGSVGHGLAVATGMAFADRSRDVYCLISDGECQEGVTFECALFARQNDLTNLHVIVDANGLQACGPIDEIGRLDTAYEFFKQTFPDIRVIPTIKGDGVDFMEGKYEWHYRNMNKEQLEAALAQI